MAKTLQHWHRLDNSAKIYPMLVNKQNQNLFSISVNMNEDIDPQTLQQALEITMERFPSFNVRLKKGIFWYYFEENTVLPHVEPLSDIAIKKITPSSCNGFCFRISYFLNRLTADFFHAIADGNGAMKFVLSIIYSYLNLKGLDLDSEKKVLTVGSPVNPAELEDSFLTNYKKLPLKNLAIDSLKGEKAYKIKGILFDNSGRGIIHVFFNSSEMLALARSKGFTVTELLGAYFIKAIFDSQIDGKPLPQEKLQLFLPINLRKMFGSQTLRNFSLFSRVGISPAGDMSVEAVAQAIHEALVRDTRKEFIEKKISTTVRAEKLFIMRIMPLIVKKFIFKFSNLFFGKSKKTASFSNVGVLDLPESMRPYIQDVSFAITANKDTPLSMTAVTSYDTLCVTFTRCISDTDIERRFCGYLTAEGLNLDVVSNFWEVDHAL